MLVYVLLLGKGVEFTALFWVNESVSSTHERYILEHYFERIFNIYLLSRQNISDSFLLNDEELESIVYRLFLLSLR